MNAAFDLIDCDGCSRDCESCMGTGLLPCSEDSCEDCDGTGDNQESCSRCNESRMMVVPKGIGY